jgi:uncharacterized membrane protein
MRTVNKGGWMIWAIVALAVMNIATIATVIYNRNHTGQVAYYSHSATGEDGASLRFSGRYFRDRLELDRDQMTRFRDFNFSFRQNAREINLSLGKIRREMLAEMSSENTDTVRLSVLSDSVGLLHAQLKKETYRYYMNFKNICNREQKEKLDSMFGEMFVIDGPAGNMQGGQNRRGRGRQMLNQ